MCVCVLCVCARARALHIRPSDFSSLNLLGASDRSLRLAVRYLPSTLTRTCWPSTKPASASVMVSVIAVLPSPMMDLVATVGRDKAKRYERPPHVRPNRLRRTTSPLSTRPRTGRLPRCCRRPSRASRSSPPARCGGRAKAPAGRPLRGHVIGMRNEKCGMRNESECGMKQQNPSATSCHRYLAPRCPPPLSSFLLTHHLTTTNARHYRPPTPTTVCPFAFGTPLCSPFQFSHFRGFPHRSYRGELRAAADRIASSPPPGSQRR